MALGVLRDLWARCWPPCGRWTARPVRRSPRPHERFSKRPTSGPGPTWAFASMRSWGSSSPVRLSRRGTPSRRRLNGWPVRTMWIASRPRGFVWSRSIASRHRGVSRRQDAWPLAATAYLEGHPDGSRAALVAVRLGGEGLPLDRLVDLAMSGDPGVRRSVRSTIARRLATSEPEGRGEVLEAWRRLGPVEVERDARAAGDAEARREAYEAIAVLIAGEDGDLARARDLLMRLDPDGPGSGTDERAMARGLAAEVALASGDPVVARTSRQAALVAELDRSRQGSAGWIVARPSAWLQRVEVGWGRSRDAAARSRALAEAWASLAIESAEAVLSEAAGREAAPGSTTPTSSAELAIRAAALAAAGEAERYALRGVRTPSAAEPWRRAAERLAELADGEAGGPWRGEALEAVAAASAAAGRWNDVLDASRRLIAGRPRGGEAWRAAKALQIEALAELDPVQARAVLEQHRVLDPEWDRGAVGMRLRRLHERLPEALP